MRSSVNLVWLLAGSVVLGLDDVTVRIHHGRDADNYSHHRCFDER
jgi:hypothetical protein